MLSDATAHFWTRWSRHRAMAGAHTPRRCTFAETSLSALAAIDTTEWQGLAQRAFEPNVFFDSDWASAIDQLSRGRTNVDALVVRRPDRPADQRLDAVMPVISAWRALRAPLPVLVSADCYAPLATPWLDASDSKRAMQQLCDGARLAGAHALLLRDIPLNGRVMRVVTCMLGAQGTEPIIAHSHSRAFLEANGDADAMLRNNLGAKRWKELRRQRKRLAVHGDVSYRIARVSDVNDALEMFLTLEAGSWKGRRGTAMSQSSDADLIRRAAPALATRGQCEIVSLYAGDTPVAAAIVLRHRDRAFFFKIGVDERFAAYSPGVQLTLDLTRQMCADETIATVDSLASPDHPMIDAIWRDRMAIGDVIVPLTNDRATIFALRLVLVARRAIKPPVRWLAHRLRALRMALSAKNA